MAEQEIKASGKAWDLNAEELARRDRLALAKKGLEPTLPWRIKVIFENVMGEEVCTWDTGLTIRNWDDEVDMRFRPATDIEMGIS